MPRSEDTLIAELEASAHPRTLLGRLNTTLTIARARYPTWALVVWAFAVLAITVWVHLPNDLLRAIHSRHQEMLGVVRKLVSPHPVPGNVVLVEITDATCRALGQEWPFPYEKLAELVKKVRDKGATVIVPCLADPEGELLRFPADSAFVKELVESRIAVAPRRPDGGSILVGDGAGSFLDEGPGRLRERFGISREVELVAPSAPYPLSWHVKAFYHGEARRRGEASASPIDPGRDGDHIQFGAQAGRVGLVYLQGDGCLIVDPMQIEQLPRVDAREILANTEPPDSLKDRIAVLALTTRNAKRIRVAPSMTMTEAELGALAIANLDTQHLLGLVPWWANYLLMIFAIFYGIQTALAPREEITGMFLKEVFLVIFLPLVFLAAANAEIDYVRPGIAFLAFFGATLALRRTERGGIAEVLRSGNTLGSTNARTGGAEIEPGPGEDVLEHLAAKFLGDRFKLLGTLGTGGMGSVFRAYSHDMKAEVALKVLHPQHVNSKEMVRRFYREFEIQSKLNHPGFVRVFEKGEGSLPWFSMQILKGEALDVTMEARGRLDQRTAFHVFRKAAEAMAYAHGKGVMHRDLKPGNLMVTDSNDVLILDMGLARFEEASVLTSDGKILGTIRYMSPEQITGAEVGTRSDIFSLVVILHEMLTGKLPYSPMDPKRDIRSLPAPLSEYGSGLPPELDTLMLACMTCDPARRPATFTDILDRMDGFLTAPARGEE